ncbi:hypothetical protein ACJXU0_005315, partial [Klebsiella pneumoniae]
MLESIRRLNGILFPRLDESAPDEPPENIRLQRAFPFYRFLNRPVGRLYHQYQYSQNQMNDCLNWCISAFMLRKFAVAPS